MKKPLFPNVPEDVTGLSDDDLAKLIGEAEDGLDKVEAGETDGRSQAELYEEVKTGVEALNKLRGERDHRAEAAAEQAEKMAELIKLGRGDADPDGEQEEETPDGEEPSEDAETEDDEEAIAASGEKDHARPTGTSGERILKLARAKQAQRPQRASESMDVAIVASADVQGFGAGQPLESSRDIADAMTAKHRNLGASSVDGEKVPVVTMRWDYPDERRLETGMSESGVAARIAEVVGGGPRGRAPAEAITASGGLCAPVEIRYDLPVLAQADRPVRDSLPNFGATRGGIRFATPPSLASITTAVGRITAAADLAGGSGAQKGCQVIACPPFVEVDVAAIYHCIQFGNMGSRAYPELVENATELTMAAWARVAETALLDAMRSASTHATVALTPSNTAALGANAILLPSLLRASAAMRSRQRMDPEAILDVWLPAWTLDLLTSDIVRSQFDRFAANDADLTRTMESYALRVNFFWDGFTAAAQVFGAQSNNAALLEFPATVEYIMAPAGSFLYLDGGTLDLGLVRDSVLNKTNDYQMFGESWENLAFVGLESLAVSASVCDTGAVAAAVQSVCGS